MALQSRSLLVLTLALASGTALLGCGGDAPSAPPGPRVASIFVTPASKTLVFLGERVQLVATALDARGFAIPDQTFTWAVSDASIATVDASGEVVARGAGGVTVTASTAGVDGRATVVVNPALASTRCVVCHAGTAGHLATAFPGTSCPACHLNAFTFPFTAHGAPAEAHVSVASGFDLVGAHDVLPCARCHDLGSGAPLFAPRNQTDCIACHRANYQAQHGAVPGWPTTCLSCHTTSTFKGATFDHASGSGGFTLLGAHAQLTCTKCHDAATWTPLFAPRDQNDCITCHRANYQAQHGAAPGWPTTCLSCHTTSTFKGATFTHTTPGGFTLVGAHTQLVCTKCHDATTWTPLFTPQSNTDCIACHRATYQAQHGRTPGWPTTCLTCHTTSTFQGATFDHDRRFFPIFSGEHAGKWTATGCQTCHVQPTDYTVFSCFACHKHNRTDMDAEHRGRSGYVYDSKACVGCHPRP